MDNGHASDPIRFVAPTYGARDMAEGASKDSVHVRILGYIYAADHSVP